MPPSFYDVLEKQRDATQLPEHDAGALTYRTNGEKGTERPVTVTVKEPRD